MRVHLATAALLAAAFSLSACSFEASFGSQASDTGSDGAVEEEPGDVRAGDDPVTGTLRFGFLLGADAGGPDAHIEFDEAVWVSSDDEPNGYRIDNPETTVETLRLADDATLIILRSIGDPATIEVVDAPAFAMWLGEQLSRGYGLPFELVVDGTEVVEARFIYTP